MSPRWVRTVVVGIVAILLAAVPSVANASFDGAASDVISAGAAVLTPPSDVGYTCAGSDGGITLTWTAPPDSYVDGYDVTVSSASSRHTEHVDGHDTTTTTVQTTVQQGATVTVVSTVRNWTSRATDPITVPEQCP